MKPLLWMVQQRSSAAHLRGSVPDALLRLLLADLRGATGSLINDEGMQQ